MHVTMPGVFRVNQWQDLKKLFRRTCALFKYVITQQSSEMNGILV